MPPLTLLVFVVGAAALGIEIAVVRLLAPYFGASEVVWANTIGVVLVALAIGYWLGGKLADRHPQLPALCSVILIAAALTAALPFAARPLLESGVRALDAISAGAFVGSLIFTLLLVAAPVLLLGTVAPWALRLGLDDVEKEQAGALAGRLYAVSTAGSLVGTLLAALVLVPGIGTRRSFLVFALALALIALPGVARRGRAALVTVGAAAILFSIDGAIKPQTSGAKVIFETETAHQYARVLQTANGTRKLELNEGQAIHSLARPGTALTDDYWDSVLVLPMATRGAAARSIAILGSAAGTMARAQAHYFPRTAVTAVEIDDQLPELGQRYFGLPSAGIELVTADARPYLRASDRHFDAIVIDAYRQPYIPFYLTTAEFFALTKERLTAGGVAIVNIGHPEGSTTLERTIAATMRTSFAHVMRDPTRPTNTMLIASNAPISSTKLRRAGQVSKHPELTHLAAREAALLAPALPGGKVFTDDHAPVEWLIDRSIVRYAAGK